MIQFSKLRLQGFKSFVDKTDLEIGLGLTGIVGPNGCGKSNLVEALRWNMGENSSKRMRGGSRSMEDVIFNGTEKRPARNNAEVSILLDNSARTAPGPYNDSDEIEVVRRIERDHGSNYKINGKTVRARDVQLLYADMTSGAGSPFLVSQGKVTSMIQAKPVERRQVLEEAAGITGLYARRHEAELRLRATDNNLKRLDDLLGGMESRLNALKKQARQANRYRNLSGQIRQLEVMVSSLEWRKSHEKLQEIERAFGEAESAVAERMLTVSQLTQTQNVQSEDIPGLREEEARMSAGLQAQKLALQRLEDEMERLESQLQESKNQLEQLYRDRGHEQETLTENSSVLERLDSEEKTILAGQENEDAELERRETVRRELQEETNKQEAIYTELMEKLAADRGRKQELERQIEQNHQRRDSLRQRLEAVQEQLADRKAEQDKAAEVEALRQNIAVLQEKSDTLRESVQAQETNLTDIRTCREEQRQDLQEKENARAKLISEIEALESIIKVSSDEEYTPVFEDIKTEEGFELALSRALGDTLMASTDENAPISWRRSSAVTTSLPAGVKPLLDVINAPDILHPALSQVGLVDTVDHGHQLASQLHAGQSLVSRDGAYWRWDGLFVRETASDRHAVQLQQQNRLIDLTSQKPAMDKAVQEQTEQFEDTERTYREAQEKFTVLKQELQETETTVRGQRAELDRESEAQTERQTELAKLTEIINIAQSDLETLEEALREEKTALQKFDDSLFEEQQNEIDSAREKLTNIREKLQTAISDAEVSKQEQNRRNARLQAIGDERVNLQNRCIRANERLKELEEREEQLKTRIEDLKQRPVSIKKESEELLSKITAKEQEKAIVSDKLAACETELADTNKALKQAEAALAEVRESRVHAQATSAERKNQMEDLRAYIQENFNMSPEELAGEAALNEDSLPDLEELKEKKDKAIRSRDTIGPVNLRADQEAEELEKELGGILAEKNDLVEAIEELRQGIETLNKEARERLQAAFEQVDTHFREMFGRLFIGGKAHLALIESDDPLEAGLEIFAQPPGKALQSLSLLSGGEQTLTAIALIFAMFRTKPSPICVLDEVDAPLDDANVDRFCDLLEEFAEKGETRFLLITHHRLTMARMDRLYGVTMSEKGVSQLVSVDMNEQLDFLEAAE